MTGVQTCALPISVMTPRINLCGFKKIHLDAGETKKVSFTVTADDLSLVNRKEERVTEPGLFTLYLAPHCPDFTYEDEICAKVIAVTE